MSSMFPKGSAQTTSKHGKAKINRLYSTLRRGGEKQTPKQDRRRLIAVCGNQAREFIQNQPVSPWLSFFSHGAAIDYAHEREHALNKHV